jgi:hypothetical protein
VAVSTAVVAIYDQARLHQMLDQANESSNVLAQSMGDLNNAANRAADIPAVTCDMRSISAREMELAGLDRRHLYGSQVSDWIPERAFE